jgi:hypothetical protein
MGGGGRRKGRGKGKRGPMWDLMGEERDGREGIGGSGINWERQVEMADGGGKCEGEIVVRQNKQAKGNNKKNGQMTKKGLGWDRWVYGRCVVVVAREGRI